MSGTVKARFGRTQSATGTLGSPTTVIRRWTVSLRKWWIDYCAREALRTASDTILLEAGCRRTEVGRVVPLHWR